MNRGVLVLVSALGAACGEEAGRGGSRGADAGVRSADGAALEPCDAVGPAIVTDIDETLTTTDEEFIMQLVDGSYDPLPRDGGAELMTAYAERGYFILYLTSRSEELVLQVTEESARDATERWLSEQGFPSSRTRVELAPTNAELVGEPARAYKAATLAAMIEEGFTFDYAYGNADTDIAAYDDAGIAKEATFIIGPLAGDAGTVAITEDGWEEHLRQHADRLPPVCRP